MEKKEFLKRWVLGIIMMMRLAVQRGPGPVGGPLNEEDDLQRALSLFISHVVLIYNNTAGENMRPAGPAEVNDALQVWRGARRFSLGCWTFTLLAPSAPISPKPH